MEILARRFGKKIKLPPTVQIKREILLTEVEAAEVRKDRFEKCHPNKFTGILAIREAKVGYWHKADIPSCSTYVRFQV